jgi:hypothetical protein
MTNSKAQQLSRAETAAYDAMMEASNNWIDRNSEEQYKTYEHARDNWHLAIQAMNDEFTAHPECFAQFAAQW